MKKVATVCLLSVFVLTGCNTVKGFGEDLSKMGQAIADKADQTKNKQ